MSILNQIAYDEFQMPMVGETSLVNGMKCMCIAPYASYGGGAGSLWATEQHIAQFALHNFFWKGYMKGVCLSVDPIQKSVKLMVLEGPSWGQIAQGSIVEIPAHRFKRYESIERVELELSRISLATDAKTRAEHIFEEVTRSELERAFIGAQTDNAKIILGERLADSCASLISEYLALHHAMQKSGGWDCHQPSKKALRCKKKLQQIFDEWKSQQP